MRVVHQLRRTLRGGHTEPTCPVYEVGARGRGQLRATELIDPARHFAPHPLQPRVMVVRRDQLRPIGGRPRAVDEPVEEVSESSACLGVWREVVAMRPAREFVQLRALLPR